MNGLILNSFPFGLERRQKYPCLLFNIAVEVLVNIIRQQQQKLKIKIKRKGVVYLQKSYEIFKTNFGLSEFRKIIVGSKFNNSDKLQFYINEHKNWNILPTVA